MTINQENSRSLIRGTIVATVVLAYVSVCQADFVVLSISSSIDISGSVSGSEWERDLETGALNTWDDFDSFMETTSSGYLSGSASIGPGEIYGGTGEAGADGDLNWMVGTLSFLLDSATSAYSSPSGSYGTGGSGQSIGTESQSSISFYMQFELTTPYWAELNGNLLNLSGGGGGGGNALEVSGGAYGTYEQSASTQTDVSFADARLLEPGLYSISLDLGSSAPPYFVGSYHEGSAGFLLNFAPVPEPSSLTLLGVGIVGMLGRGVYRRRAGTG